MPGGGGNQQTSSQTTSSGPWPVTRPYLKDALGEAGRLYESKKGFHPYPGEGYVPFSSQSQSGLNTMQNLASRGNPMSGGAIDLTKGLLGGQFNQGTSGFQGLLNSTDPEFENVVQNTANDVGDQLQRNFGGASYGSAANADYLTKGVGDVVSQMRSNNFQANQNFKRGLLGDISTINQQNLGNRMAGVGLMDQAYQSQFAPAERMMQVGGAYEGKSGEKLQAAMDKFNIKDMAPWDRLAQAFGIFSGTGAQGNRVQTSVSQPTDPWSKILGGGLLASQFFG